MNPVCPSCRSAVNPFSLSAWKCPRCGVLEDLTADQWRARALAAEARVQQLEMRAKHRDAAGKAKNHGK